jgi:uncharacterized protein YfbU (UPF0304 family)
VKVRGDTDVDLLSSAMYGGHYWGLKWNSHLFDDSADSPEVVADVGNFLDMWSFIESAYAKLSKKEKERIEKEAPLFGRNVSFRGFDGNNESEYMGVARFFIEKLGRFTNFKGRELNSHAPTVAAYKRMYRLFEPMRPNLGMGVVLGADQIIELMQALPYRK